MTLNQLRRKSKNKSRRFLMLLSTRLARNQSKRLLRK